MFRHKLHLHLQVVQKILYGHEDFIFMWLTFMTFTVGKKHLCCNQNQIQSNFHIFIHPMRHIRSSYIWAVVVQFQPFFFFLIVVEFYHLFIYRIRIQMHSCIVDNQITKNQTNARQSTKKFSTRKVHMTQSVITFLSLQRKYPIVFIPVLDYMNLTSTIYEKKYFWFH